MKQIMKLMAVEKRGDTAVKPRLSCTLINRGQKLNFLDTEKSNQARAMAEVKHLVVAKFKEGAAVDEVIKGMEKLASEIDFVSSFEWGQDIQSPEMLRQGFTHAFLMTFKTQEDFSGFLGHPKHVEFSATFSTVIENVILLDFPAVLVKPTPAA